MINPLAPSTSAVPPSASERLLPTAAPVRRPEWRGKLLMGLALLALSLPPLLFPDNEFRLGLLAKFMAVAILALGVDLVWGYTGMLSLGQGVFFGIGAYAVAFSLALQYSAEVAGKPVGTVPIGFMNYTNLPMTHPDYVPPHELALVAPLGNIWVALAAAVVLSTLAAGLFGFITFRLRIKGVYFALVTQALLLAVFLLVDNNQSYTGGRVGIKDLNDLQLFGITFSPYPAHVHALYWLCLGVLLACFLACVLLISTRFGKVLTAIRDNENRVLALGYDTVMYKTFVFALAGCLAGIAGALYVAANQVCGPTYLGVTWSIEAVIFVAVGGRGTLFGAVLGAMLVNLGKSYISEAYPDYWNIILGFLFIGVVLFMPNGILGLFREAGELIQGSRLFSRPQKTI